MKVFSILAGLCFSICATSALAFDPVFYPRVDYAAGDGATWIAAADLDGDGKTDLATANSLSNDV